jgi:hypothetical protein
MRGMEGKSRDRRLSGGRAGRVAGEGRRVRKKFMFVVTV